MNLDNERERERERGVRDGDVREGSRVSDGDG